MNSLMALLVFAIVAALFLGFSGRPRLSRLILVVCFVGIVADQTGDAVRYLAHRRTTAEASASTQAPSQRRKLIPPRPGYAQELPNLERESMSWDICENAKGKPTLYLTPKNRLIWIHVHFGCWSRQICVRNPRGGNAKYDVQSVGYLTHCTYYRNGFGRFEFPFCFGPGGPSPYIGGWGPSCFRVSGDGTIQAVATFESYPNG